MVDDTSIALQYLGAKARRDSRAKVIGVTGSVGKTSTKEMLRVCLSRDKLVHANVGSHNNAIGVPLTLANLGEQCDYLVAEMGMNHKGEILELTSLVRPHLALVTSIAETHIGNFASVSEIADAKAEIFSGLEPPGKVVLNRDNPFYRQLWAAAEPIARDCITFGRSSDATVKLVELQTTDSEALLTAEIPGKTIRYRLTVLGSHWAYNSLGVIACLYALGEDVEAGAAALSEFELLAGRGRVDALCLGKKKYSLIDESYNASPPAVVAALRVLGEAKLMASGRRIAVLGDMMELGIQEQFLHENLRSEVIAARPSMVFTVGSRMLHLRKVLPAAMRGQHFDSAEDVIEPLLKEIRPYDVVLIKGSRSVGMSCIVSALRSISREGEEVADMVKNAL